MDQSSAKSIFIKIGIAVLVIVLIDLFYLNYWILKSGKLRVESGKSEEVRELSPEPSPSPTILALPSPSPAPSPAESTKTTTIVEKETVIQTAQKEIFIPLGSGSIANKNWTAIPGLEVEIDTSKYSGIESIRFEATIWPEGGNGKAYARVYNVTDNNPYVESEISSSSNTGSYQNSNSIPFPSLSKTYGIQAKSGIENFPTHVENARIKITLK